MLFQCTVITILISLKGKKVLAAFRILKKQLLEQVNSNQLLFLHTSLLAVLG